LKKPKDSSTGPLHNHMTRLHPIEYEANSSDSSSKRGKNAKNVKKTTQVATPKLTEESFREALVKFVVNTNQSFSIVESTELRELVELISKDHQLTKLPGRTLMTTTIQQQFTYYKKKLAQELQSLTSKVSLIIDCWTSSNQLAFQGVIARFIDKNWNLCTIPLDLTLLSGPHTGENIAHSLLKVVEEFGITDKIGSITTDNAANMDTFFVSFANLLEGKGHIFDINNQRIRCLAHIVNLSAKDALQLFEKGNSWQ